MNMVSSIRYNEVVPNYIERVQDLPKKVVAIVYNDEETLDNVVASRNNAIKYMKAKIESLKKYMTNDASIVVFFNSIRIKTFNDTHDYQFLEFDLGNMYSNPTNISTQLIKELRDYLIDNDWDYDDYTTQHKR